MSAKRVTPSRVCELKSVNVYKLQQAEPSHPHGCVSWNYLNGELSESLNCHTLTGVWVEICDGFYAQNTTMVTPSRVCELKSIIIQINNILQMSHPHGCVSWNCPRVLLMLKQQVTPSRVCELKYIRVSQDPAGCCHTLTGVWVEIDICINIIRKPESHPHGCVSWNLVEGCMPILDGGHTLTGVWVEMVCLVLKECTSGHTLTGVWVEIWRRLPTLRRWYSHTLTGVWVEIPVGYDIERLKKGHTLTGVWVEIPDNFSNVW